MASSPDVQRSANFLNVTGPLPQLFADVGEAPGPERLLAAVGARDCVVVLLEGDEHPNAADLFAFRAVRRGDVAPHERGDALALGNDDRGLDASALGGRRGGAVQGFRGGFGLHADDLLGLDQWTGPLERNISPLRILLENPANVLQGSPRGRPCMTAARVGP